MTSDEWATPMKCMVRRRLACIPTAAYPVIPRRGACVPEKATPTKKLEGNAVALQLYVSMFGVGLFQHLLTIDDEHTVFSLLNATALKVVDAPILLLGINFVYTRYREYYIHRAIKCLRGATIKRENDV